VVEVPPVEGAIRQLEEASASWRWWRICQLVEVVEDLPVGRGGGSCLKGSPEGGGLVEASAARWWRI